MNTLYFVRHAKPDFSIHDDLTRPLTQEGMEASKNLTRFFLDKNITKFYSSPYKRSIDTILDLSEHLGLEIIPVEDFRERKISNGWIEDFNTFSKIQWEDFEYKLEEGECLREVQARNISALHKILNENDGENIVIGTHGTALSAILNYYDKTFDYSKFEMIKDKMPWVVCLKFEGMELLEIELDMYTNI